jgi:membrane-associated phospholipid phosphatase
MQPLDLATFVYAATSLLMLVVNRPAAWAIWSLPHLAIIGVIVWQRVGERRTSGWLREWYPLLLLPFFYAELPTLNQPFLSSARDDSIRFLESLLFPFDPSHTLALAVPSRAVSETLHFAYLSYYPLIYGPLLLLYWRDDRHAFRETALAVMTTYYCCYLIYILSPVRGPWDLLPVSQTAPAGPLRQLAVHILQAGSSIGAAFPSSHQAVATTQAMCAMRHLPRLAPVIGLVSLGIGVGAVYGSFHYAADVAAGAAVGLLVATASWRISARTFEYERTAVIASRERSTL